ncbi:hypothetical protein [Azonexus sp.]|uniref:hypothetical protein n=1 Tax=Azonexus sp. TaxID=1872668 RepID=UPI0035B3CE30
MIRSKGFPLSLSAAHLWRDDAPLKSHYAYQKAKAGDKDAALELVVDLAVTWVSGLRERLKPALVYVSPHAQEATGDNAIPQTLAAVCATLLEGDVDTGIVQSDRVYHTGADPMERMAARAQFFGKVLTRQIYRAFVV